MNLVTLEGVSKQFSERLLLDAVNLRINEGDRIGLIGNNQMRKQGFKPKRDITYCQCRGSRNEDQTAFDRRKITDPHP